MDSNSFFIVCVKAFLYVKSYIKPLNKGLQIKTEILGLWIDDNF
jgi:hypothetical protein